MEAPREIERIAKLKESEIGPTEENVKQKVVVPLLELLGHKKDDLEFEYRTRRGGKIDIFIGHVPNDCKVIIDTKNYSEDLGDHVEQIKEYTFDEAPLMAILANGTEIRLYSPLRGIAFEKSLLYCLRRERLSDESAWSVLWELVALESLRSKRVLKTIAAREQEIRDAIVKEEHVRQELQDRVDHIEEDIERKEEEIEDLQRKREQSEEDANREVSRIWEELGLPAGLVETRPLSGPVGPRPSGPIAPGPAGKARKVRLEELVRAGLLRDGETLYFAHAGVRYEEEATVIASSSKLRYKSDNRTYSVSKLALILLRNHHLKHDTHSVAGPLFWRTRDGKLLNDLNEQVRMG